MGLMHKSVEALACRFTRKAAEMRGSSSLGRASTPGLKGPHDVSPALHLPPRSFQRSGAGPQNFESVGVEA